jgi:CubicO group peptidase (beta-lactamase class C family)
MLHFFNGQNQRMVNKMKKNILQVFIFILSFVMWWNFGLAADEKPDYWPTKGWRTASPESQGVDSNLLENMLNIILKKNLYIDSALVARNGYIVLDAYRYGVHSNDTHNIYSSTKSVMSALIGIAIDKGYIKGVNQPVLDFFKKRDAKNLDANKKAMTLEHLLTMTYLDNYKGLGEMRMSLDWVQFVIDLPMADPPGTRFEYCNGASFLLSAILQEQTGMNALKFAHKHLFGPLGISNVIWPSNAQGITIGYGRLSMRPQDMAKIGYLYLNDGLWDGQRIISSQWIKESTRKHIDADLLPGYGYQWWIVSPSVYTSVGSYGQHIIVSPEKKMVVVFTSSLLDRKGDYRIPLDLLAYHIMPALKSSSSLPENPIGEKALKSIIAQWQTTSIGDRREIAEKEEKSSQSLKLEEYVNNEYGFSAKYDAELVNIDSQLVAPRVFRRRGLRGLPIFVVLVDDIPQKMALENTGNYIIDRYKMNPRITDPKIKIQELIKLSDGTDANYFEINWRLRHLSKMLTVGVLAYKNNRIIGAVAVSTEETPTEYLASMAKSLRFKK